VITDYGSFRMPTVDMGPTQSDRRLKAEDSVAPTSGLPFNRVYHNQWYGAFYTNKINLYPYHAQRVQVLKVEDLPRRVNFCECFCTSPPQ
jgi:hypothetical protein